jgi:hypothetical protein
LALPPRQIIEERVKLCETSAQTDLVITREDQLLDEIQASSSNVALVAFKLMTKSWILYFFQTQK